MATEQVEYRRIGIPTGPGLPIGDELIVLSKYGAEGWRVVSERDIASGGVSYLLMRRLPQKNPLGCSCFPLPGETCRCP